LCVILPIAIAVLVILLMNGKERGLRTKQKDEPMVEV
jgi:hypothetical protein